MNRTIFLTLLVATLLFGASNAMAANSKLTFAPSLNADLVYDITDSQLGYGPSLTLATFAPEQCASIKAAWIIFPGEEADNKIGLGAAISVSKVLKACGAKQIPDWFVPSISVYGLADLKELPDRVNYSWGISATLIQIKF